MLTPYKALRACGFLILCLFAALAPALADKNASSLALKLRTTTVTPPLDLSLAGITVLDTGGDGDGVLEPGETARLELLLRNDGVAPLNGVSGRLIAESTAPFVRVLDDRAAWPLIAAHDGSASASFQVEVSPDAPCGTRVELGLQLTDGAASLNLTLEQTLGRRWLGPAIALATAEQLAATKLAVAA